MNEEKKHHVAWADRIGLPKRWEEAIKKCFESYGTREFPTWVEAFEMIIVNIKDGVSLKDLVKEYKDETIAKELEEIKNRWIEGNAQYMENPSFVRDLELELNKRESKMLFEYMLQLLQDNGFGFYKGESGGEYDTWD